MFRAYLSAVQYMPTLDMRRLNARLGQKMSVAGVCCSRGQTPCGMKSEGLVTTLDCLQRPLTNADKAAKKSRSTWSCGKPAVHLWGQQQQPL
jgi:hypothetical protein